VSGRGDVGIGGEEAVDWKILNAMRPEVDFAVEGDEELLPTLGDAGGVPIFLVGLAMLAVRIMKLEYREWAFELPEADILLLCAPLGVWRIFGEGVGSSFPNDVERGDFNVERDFVIVGDLMQLWCVRCLGEFDGELLEENIGDAGGEVLEELCNF